MPVISSCQDALRSLQKAPCKKCLFYYMTHPIAYSVYLCILLVAQVNQKGHKEDKRLTSATNCLCLSVLPLLARLMHHVYACRHVCPCVMRVPVLHVYYSRQNFAPKLLDCLSPVLKRSHGAWRMKNEAFGRKRAKKGERENSGRPQNTLWLQVSHLLCVICSYASNRLSGA